MLILGLLRSETYQYYTLPFCTPKEGKEYKPEGLGEVHSVVSLLYHSMQ